MCTGMCKGRDGCALHPWIRAWKYCPNKNKYENSDNPN